MQHRTTFEQLREVTGWVRPGHDHGCKPVEIIPGLWTAHFDEIDSAEKLRAATGSAPIKLVVNSAVCQCESVDYGDGVKIMKIVLEDDPNERKLFDQGKPTTSKCREPGLALDKRTAGNAIKDFDACCDTVDRTIASGGHALIHCKASLSRSVAFILAYLMRAKGMPLLEATELMKSKWSACWPCDRFVDQVSSEKDHRPPSAVRPCLVPRSTVLTLLGSISRFATDPDPDAGSSSSTRPTWRGRIGWLPMSWLRSAQPVLRPARSSRSLPCVVEEKAEGAWARGERSPSCRLCAVMEA